MLGKQVSIVQIKSECIITLLQGSLTINKGRILLDHISRCKLSTVVPLYCGGHNPIPQWVPESMDSTEAHIYYDTDLFKFNL